MTKDAPIVLPDPDTSRDNEVRPFRIGKSLKQEGIRGRAVRLGTVAEQILSAHAYPDPVARILGEALALIGMLGSILKTNGIITLQLKSSGPIPMLVADYTLDDRGGHLRGYADVDNDKLGQYGKQPSFEGLIGSKKGYFAITIDREEQERYQGIVDLRGDSMAAVAETYFQQSEQLPTALHLSADKDPISDHWRAGGAMIQHLSRTEEGQARILDVAGKEEWNRTKILLETLKTREILDPGLTLDEILFRLFHEDGVRVFDATRIDRQCRCDRDRLVRVLSTFPPDDIKEMTVKGVITMNCQFCNKTFEFDPAILS